MEVSDKLSKGDRFSRNRNVSRLYSNSEENGYRWYLMITFSLCHNSSQTCTRTVVTVNLRIKYSTHSTVSP